MKPVRKLTEDVRAFHLAMGQPVEDEPRFTGPNTTLRVRLQDEETEETGDALRDSDMVELADGLADVAYIAAGTAVSCGVDPYGNAQSYLRDWLIRETDTLNSAMHHEGYPDPTFYGEATAAGVLRLEVIGRGIASLYGIPFDEVWDEVHRSNMGKLWPDGKPRTREDGKILKPPSWSAPDIKTILHTAGIL